MLKCSMWTVLLISTKFLYVSSSYWNHDPGGIFKMADMNHTLGIVGNDFILGGQPLNIISGSLHYFRVPAAYWRDRLRKMKAAGLNTVSTYVEWSFHEPEERQYKFKGDRNVAKFAKMAAEEGLFVLIRPGPYIRAERDLGGLPYWLLGKYPEIKLRTTDKNFIKKTEIWMNKLFKHMTPLLFGNGGPIIMVQVENEYGSFGSDITYKKKIRDILLKHIGNKALLYTTDGRFLDYIVRGAVPGALATVNFGFTKDIQLELDSLRNFMPVGPLMNSEFYVGRTSYWGEQYFSKSSKKMVNVLKELLDNNVNVNIYMYCGGTNFGFSSGASYKDDIYQPTITSYDYDSPISEAGDLTAKYYDIRNTIMNFKQEVFDPPPRASPKGSYGNVVVRPRFNIMSPEGRAALGRSYNDVTGSILPTFESLRQRSGLMLYETIVDDAIDFLIIRKPRDLVFVYVDGVLQGTIKNSRKRICLPSSTKKNVILSLLVENQGRNNAPTEPINDRKGILSKVELNNQILNGTWKVTGFPLEHIKFSGQSDVYESIPQSPALYEGQFSISDEDLPMDTFLDTSGWGKGYVWINGHNLGRYWPAMGPQVTLYVPGVWLKSMPDHNHIIILELIAPKRQLTMNFIDYPIVNVVKKSDV